MKIALYIEDGREQIVLTPETDTEKRILAKMHDGSREMKLHRGSFFECRGGWTRYRQGFYGFDVPSGSSDESTMIVLNTPIPAPPESPPPTPPDLMDGGPVL